MKFCKDCTHLRLTICTNPRLTYVDLVSGNNKHYYAENARAYDYLCGKEAVLFEQLVPAPMPDEPF